MVTRPYIARALRSLAPGCWALLCLATPGVAQVAYDSPTGRVEVLGLRRWTLDMLRDSIRRYVPGQELHDAACMVTLRDSLGFAEASVVRFVDAPPGAPRRTYLTIKLIEPQEASRVQWDTRPRDEFSSLLPDYAPLVLPITDSIGAVWRGRLLYWLQASDSADRARLVSAVPAKARASARVDADRATAFLRAHRSEGDRRRAMKVLRDDGFWVNRMVAVVVLANFAAHDSTWWALARALRDPHEGVRQTAGTVLSALPPRPVDWGPATADLRLLLGGTNLPVMQDLFDVLAKTAIAPELAPALLRGNADWVLEHLAAETPMASTAARRLLARLNRGVDLGPTRAAWTAWAAAL